MNRRAGVTLVELMVGMVMSAFVGTMMVSLLLTSTRFNDRVDAGREARGTARTPLNLITTELRMVNAETGVLAAGQHHLERVAGRFPLAPLEGRLSGQHVGRRW